MRRLRDMPGSAMRLLAVCLLGIAVVAIAVLGVGAKSGDGAYRVRAIFDSASFIVPGEDVKVAGVKVGAVDSLDVTPQHKAVIVLRIDDPAFRDFKQDASCTIRLQSLIGEKFVACEPTQPRDANTEPAPPLHKLTGGPGKGQYYLPVTNTSSPVDVDLLGDIMRVPERQRFSIILNELGVGLAGNGEELRAVIRRADPGLQQFDRVLAILASQNKVLANLATESDAALAPLARNASRISDFINTSGQTAQATAERGDAFEQNFAKLPAFLAQLTPTSKRLGEFAAAGEPVFANLRQAAPSVNKIFEQLGPFATASIPTFRTLGRLSDIGTQALQRSQPVINDLSQFGKQGRPLAANLANALGSLQKQNGIQRLLDVILFTNGTTNGFDSVSHFLRTFLVLPTACITYATAQSANSCPATFNQQGSAAPASAAQAPSSAALPASSAPPVGGSLADISAPSGAGSGTTTPAAQPAQPPAGLLSYLLGNGGGK
jgi:phospholipid/cholesterol/gamma-HCH transport system substrate-binding protein